MFNAVRKMDPRDFIPVRFHFGGWFNFDVNLLNHVNGRVELSHVERDKVSLLELRRFLLAHVALTDEDNVDFYWLFPRDDLSNGLRRLSDDKTCFYMFDCITDGVVDEIYVEIYMYDGRDQGGVQFINEGGV